MAENIFVVVYVQHCCDAVRETSAVMPSVVAVVPWCLGPRPATPVGVNVLKTWQVSRLRAFNLYFSQADFLLHLPLWSYHWAFDGWRFAVTEVQLFLFAFLVSTREMDGKAEGRWLGTSPCVNEVLLP